MILIFTENISYSARYVTRHLLKMKQDFEVFLESDIIDFNYNLNPSRNQVSIYRNGEFLCKYEDIRSVWAHRSEIHIKKSIAGISEEEEIYLKRHYDTQVQSI